MRGTLNNDLAAVLRVASAIATDVRNALVGRNLIKKPWQDKRVADTVVGHSMARISSVDASIPRCTLRPWRR